MNDILRRARDFPFDRVRPIVLRSVVGALIVAAAVSVFSVLIGDFGDTSWKLLGTAALFVFFALCSWYDADVSARRYPVFASASFLVSIFIFVVGLIRLWGPDLSEHGSRLVFADNTMSFLWVAFVARAALLHLHIVLSTGTRLRTPTIAAVSRVTLWLVAALGTMLVLPALVVGGGYGDVYWRIVTVIAILDALGTVLIPLTYALFHINELKAPSAPDNREVFRPPAAAYAKPGAPLKLMWPKYHDGTPLPAGADGNPDFTGVLGYETWVSRGAPRTNEA